MGVVRRHKDEVRQRGGVQRAREFNAVERIHLDEGSLDSEHGAKELYQKLVRAAELACPAPVTGTRLVSGAVLECRKEAVARAVQQINNPRLVAIAGR